MTNKTNPKPTPARRSKPKAIITGGNGHRNVQTEVAASTLSSPAQYQPGPSGTSPASGRDAEASQGAASSSNRPNSVPVTNSSSPLAPPILNRARELEAARLERVSPYEFDIIVWEYLTGLDSNKVDKALFTRDMRHDVFRTLSNPRDTSVQTAQYRHWARKTFRLVNGGIIHQRKNKPCALKDDMYEIITMCHEHKGHGGRDVTHNYVGSMYAYIPKVIIAEFCMRCPICIKKDGNKAELKQMRDADHAANAGGSSVNYSNPVPSVAPRHKTQKHSEGHIVGSRADLRRQINYTSSESNKSPPMNASQESNSAQPSTPLSASDLDYLRKASAARGAVTAGRPWELPLHPPSHDINRLSRRPLTAAAAIPAVPQQCQFDGWQPPAQSQRAQYTAAIPAVPQQCQFDGWPPAEFDVVHTQQHQSSQPVADVFHSAPAYNDIASEHNPLNQPLPDSLFANLPKQDIPAFTHLYDSLLANPAFPDISQDDLSSLAAASVNPAPSMNAHFIPDAHPNDIDIYSEQHFTVNPEPSNYDLIDCDTFVDFSYGEEAKNGYAVDFSYPNISTNASASTNRQHASPENSQDSGGSSSPAPKTPLTPAAQTGSAASQANLVSGPNEQPSKEWQSQKITEWQDVITQFQTASSD